MNIGFIGTGRIASSVITGICTSKISYKKILISNKLKKNIITKNIFFNIGQKIKKFKLGKDSIGSLILNFKSQKVMKDRMNSMDENIKIILK